MEMGLKFMGINPFLRRKSGMKHIALIALGEKTSYFCRDQLHRLLGNRINISNYYAVRWPALYDFSAFHQLP